MEDLEKLMQVKQLQDRGYSFEKIESKVPKVMIMGVQSSLTSKDLVKEMHPQNEFLAKKYEKTTFQNKVKIVRSWYCTNSLGTINWILETQPDVRTEMVAQGNKLSLEWNLIRVTEYLDATRCFHCQKYCRRTENTCGHCGQDGHTFRAHWTRYVRRVDEVVDHATSLSKTHPAQPDARLCGIRLEKQRTSASSG